VKAYFSSLDIDLGDTWTRFTPLDSKGTNEIDLEEFIIGCLGLQGQARSFDMVRLGYEMRRFARTLGAISKDFQKSDKQLSEVRAELYLMRESNAHNKSSMI